MMHADLASSGRAVRVLRYEDLVRSTEPTLRAMLRFLEIDNVDSNRIDCAKQLSDDPSVKRIKKRSATELMGNYTPGLACGLWRQISGSEQAKLLLATMGYRQPRICDEQMSRAGTSFFCDLEDVSAMSEGRGDNCGGNLASPRPMVRSSRTTTSSSSRLQLRPRVVHVRGTQSKPRETALDRARKRAAEQRAARNEKPAAGSWLAQQQRAEAARRRREMRKKWGARGK